MKPGSRWALAAIMAAVAPGAMADVFGGVEFPSGVVSFADRVSLYSPVIASGQPDAANTNPLQALGAPDWNGQGACVSAATCNTVSLGSGGSIVLEFVDNRLTGSDSSAADLWIFEVGAQVEDTRIEISPDGVVWHAVGEITGGTRGIDIDAYGWTSADQFAFVRLTDDPTEGSATGASAGADIDAIGAIATAAVPEPATLALLSGGLVLVAGAARRNS